MSTNKIFGPIRVDSRMAVSAYAEHLSKMDSDDLRLRFGTLITPERAADWARALDLDDPKIKHIIWAMEDFNGNLISVCHLAIERDNNKAEVALSTLPEARRQGYSALLIEVAMSYLRNRNIDQVYMVCLTENHAVQNLARKAGLALLTLDGESTAKLSLPWPNLNTVRTETYANTLTMIDRQMRFNANVWQKFFGNLNKVDSVE